ncbi:hypothetical protein LNK20_22030, partial [Bacillus safensis]|nr:hypothetical protein [Bacillus safensis]
HPLAHPLLARPRRRGAGRRRHRRSEYAEAARHQTAWYGQLAAEKIGAPMRPELALPGPAIDSLPDWRGASVGEARVFQA